jgi:PadR family transcriptional regulator, regulatory protein PadR
MQHHDLLSGLVRLHILHHAAKHAVYGHWIIDELARHSDRLSPSTLYPMPARLERDGYLASRAEQVSPTSRKFYTITQKRRDALALARPRLRDLKGEAGTE